MIALPMAYENTAAMTTDDQAGRDDHEGLGDQHPRSPRAPR